ncbi:hypothetical protein BFW38_06390 [Terasakiispira papahanaumokuakeensis]|uniref:Uncharacterized protein n=1 Tax=Terasakiispira papahanaumokuakeensis TaxID=197479 RepID=A0A1E2V8R0_9GAMM|nr:hypothetical protein [Terasakiispira papahanaumokuakeensis]ODC03226.1 hypothetical protein BFW38_06390 [Terasakiispira papahanaumokuakeensis]
MTLQVEFWHLLLLLLSLLGSACVAAGAFGRVLLAQLQRHLDQRFEGFDGQLAALDQGRKDEAAQLKQVERDLMELKIDLPNSYVRREDYIRGQSIIENKLDSLALKLENAQLREQMEGRYER